jgi:hypothetical protein
MPSDVESNVESNSNSSVEVDWSELPRELVCRIVFYQKQMRAAVRIQAVWRGRDCRDFLAHPASRVFNARHPLARARCHMRRCHGCFLHELYLNNLRAPLGRLSLWTAIWTIRCCYLVRYDPLSRACV